MIPAAELVTVVAMVSGGELSSKGAKEVLKKIQEGERDARAIAVNNNLMQNSDEAELRKISEEVIAEEGREKPAHYLVGQAMKKSGGRANPILLQKIFAELV
jgi:aspartyl-tRNA(Asn)/glutamyl-tRNA(Gln) amidotransferase subunit B